MDSSVVWEVMLVVLLVGVLVEDVVEQEIHALDQGCSEVKTRYYCNEDGHAKCTC